MPISPSNPFKGRQYPGEVILLAVRLYLRYPLAYPWPTAKLPFGGRTMRTATNNAS
jgi:hypothetical protein